MMRRVTVSFTCRTLALVGLALNIGCSSTPEAEPVFPSGDFASTIADSGADSSMNLDVTRSRPEQSAPAERKIIRSGHLTVSLRDPESARKEAEQLVIEAGGFVEHSRATRESEVVLATRIPAAQLDATMDRIAALGEEEYRSTSAADVTDQYADLETRLRNNTALRDRLQLLLKRAAKVEDVLAIEKELNRVQSEVEAMQGRLDRMKSQVELSALSVTLKREVVLGPLGLVGYGFWWAISKLFVIH